MPKRNRYLNSFNICFNFSPCVPCAESFSNAASQNKNKAPERRLG